MKQFAILTDTTKCIGCNRCVKACKTGNKTGKDRPWRWKKRIDDLSDSRWTTVLPAPNGGYMRKQCRHCAEPACVSACIVGALQKTPEGPVIYDNSICIGCRYCMMSCPYDIPRYSWEDPVPYIKKCTMCYERIKEGKVPYCVEACPTQATIFGDRDELLAEAKRRLKAEPNKYINRVWGEKEIGGTNVLYLSDVDISDLLAWKKDLGNTPLPHKTWVILNKMPAVFLGVGAVLGGVWWVIDRRDRLQQEKKTVVEDTESNEEKDESEEKSNDEKS